MICFSNSTKKIILCSSMLVSGLSADQVSEQQETLSKSLILNGSCQHKYCRQRRFNTNTDIIAKHEIDKQHHQEKLKAYLKNKKFIHRLYAGGSLVSGVATGIVSRWALKNKTKNTDHINSKACLAGVGAAGVLYIASKLIHKTARPEAPVLRLTQDCFVQAHIRTVSEFKRRYKNSAQFWCDLSEFTWSQTSKKLASKFNYSTYIFIEAEQGCCDTLTNLKSTKAAAQTLACYLAADGDENIQDYKDVALQASQMIKKVSKVLKKIKSSHELKMDRRTKEQAEHIDNIRKEKGCSLQEAQIQAMQKADERQAPGQPTPHWGQAQTQDPAAMARWHEYLRGCQEISRPGYQPPRPEQIHRQQFSGPALPPEIPFHELDGLAQQQAIAYWNNIRDQQLVAGSPAPSTILGTPVPGSVTAQEAGTECIICCENYAVNRQPVKLSCCRQILCSQCLAKVNQCPFCRALIPAR